MSNQKNKYDVSSIKPICVIEHVRMRPYMYLGSLHPIKVLIWFFQNFKVEWRKMNITILKNDAYEIEFDTKLEIINNDINYNNINIIPLEGVSSFDLCVINALSTYLKIWNKNQYLEFQQATLLEKRTLLDDQNLKFQFQLDPSIFKDSVIPKISLESLLQKIVHLYPKKVVTINEGVEINQLHSNGLIDLMKNLSVNTTLLYEPVTLYIENETIKANILFSFHTHHDLKAYTFLANEYHHVKDNGVHLDGIKNACRIFFKEVGLEHMPYNAPFIVISIEEKRKNIHFLNRYISFSGSTKDHICNDELEKLFENEIYKQLKEKQSIITNMINNK